MTGGNDAPRAVEVTWLDAVDRPMYVGGGEPGPEVLRVLGTAYDDEAVPRREGRAA